MIERNAWLVRISALIAAGVAARVASAQFSVDVVAYEGPPPPGYAEGVYFNAFWSADTSTEGDVGSIFASLAGPGITGANDGTIWSTESGLVKLLQAGDPAPGVEDGILDGFLDVSVGPGTTAVLRAPLEDNREGLWKRTDGPYDVLALEGGDAPGLDFPAEFLGFGSGHFGAGADAYFRAKVLYSLGGQVLDTIYTDRSGDLELLHKQGDDDGDGEAFTSMVVTGVNALGDIAIAGTTPTVEGLWLSIGGEITPVLKEGDDAPGLEGEVIGKVYSVRLNDLGQHTVYARTDGPSQKNVAFVSRAGELEPMFVSGELAPGTEPETKFGAATNLPLIDADGDIVFPATMYGPNIPPDATHAQWHDDGRDEPTILVRRGDQLPGAPEGTQIESSGQVLLNNEGRVLLRTTLFGDAVDYMSDRVLLGLSLDDPEPYQILREGDQVQVGLDDIRTVADFEIDGRLTDSGQVLVLVTFADETEAVLRVTLGDEGCLADFNGDGVLNVLDFVAFQTAFVAHVPKADCDGNGQFQILDFVCYQIAFFTGCP